MTIADAVIPQTWRRTTTSRFLVEALLILGGSAVVALSALISFRLPFTVVPITGQTFGVLLVGAALGSKRGAASLTAYLVEGALGAPVFAFGGCCLTSLFGPTGGYLFSYPLAAGITGWLAERGWDRRTTTTGLAMLFGNVTIYLIGLPWLAFFKPPVGVFEAGLLPFVPGDTVKLVLAAIALPSAWKLIQKMRGMV